MRAPKPPERPLIFLGSSRANLREFPEDVRYEVGGALQTAQEGGKHVSAKPLRGFGGATVLEIVEDYRTDTYRVVYTVKLAHAVFVLHAFQKKSKRGTETPKPDVGLIKRRYRDAERLYKNPPPELRARLEGYGEKLKAYQASLVSEEQRP